MGLVWFRSGLCVREVGMHYTPNVVAPALYTTFTYLMRNLKRYPAQH